MPNHVMNTLAFSGDAKRISEMKEKIKSDEFGLGTIDFEKIIPMPDSIYRGNLGISEMKKYGQNNWYDRSARKCELSVPDEKTNAFLAALSKCRIRRIDEHSVSLEEFFKHFYKSDRKFGVGGVSNA